MTTTGKNKYTGKIRLSNLIKRVESRRVVYKTTTERGICRRTVFRLERASETGCTVAGRSRAFTGSDSRADTAVAETF